MSRYMEPNEALPLTGGSLLVPLEVAGTGWQERTAAFPGFALSVVGGVTGAFRGVGTRMARFFAAGQLGASDAVELGRATGARC